jgi:hypothetical protein
VAVLVVDLLEAIEVGDDQGRRLTVTARSLDLRAQRTGEVPLVEEARQAVVGGEASQSSVGAEQREAGDTIGERTDTEAGEDAGEAKGVLPPGRRVMRGPTSVGKTSPTATPKAIIAARIQPMATW